MNKIILAALLIWWFSSKPKQNPMGKVLTHGEVDPEWYDSSEDPIHEYQGGH